MKNLLVLSLVSGCYAVAAADTLTGDTQLRLRAHTKYANGLNLGGYILSEPYNNVWGNLEINGLEGTGTIFIDRADGNSKPGNADVLLLTDADIAMIQSGQTVDLILSAEQMTLGNGVSELSNIYRQDSEGNLIKMSDDFKIVADYDNNKVYAMPEPATATLSLLALAGLASRRRRHEKH